jgi:hypothetical protein
VRSSDVSNSMKLNVNRGSELEAPVSDMPLNASGFSSRFLLVMYQGDMNSDCQNPVYVLGLCVAPGAEAAATASAVAVAGGVKKNILRKRREDQGAEGQVGPLQQVRLGSNHHARQVSRGGGGAAARGRALTGRDGGGAARQARVYFIARGRLRKCAKSLNIMHDAETVICSTA